MRATDIRALALAYVRTRDPRWRRGMTAQQTQLFDLEVDRLRGRRWYHAGRMAPAGVAS